ncbi:related to ferric reductase FRE2 precursor [Cephalotrichum gorgonifer]|uniref:Related to ferric reductase FRE2 n=1 Tax=Cephalotrichum gorgonifer TaxID=2041049 RepID=A0AAE8N2C5_9PEZI|nr:related to ferric reductase FRE2 precursor [Cephalotrichum gorgonifer]
MASFRESAMVRRHIQDMSTAKELEPHWGYADRVVPCVNDPGSCEYLDAVYGGHDIGMVYMGAFWLSIAAVFVVWGAIHWSSKTKRNERRRNAAYSAEQATTVAPAEGTMGRLRRAIKASTRRHLLPEAFFPFGRASRLQVLILGILVAYLTIYTFAGIVYKKWITPVSGMPGVYNTRTGLGPWSDRIGVIAYALTPLSILLSTRESFLSAVTGVPYQNFNFLHRWLGYIIVVQSSLHTIGWCIVEIRLYQPQPTVAQEWVKQLYIVWGIVAMILLLMLYVLSLPPVIRLTGYEFFRKSHYVLAMVYIGACIGHWEKLQCFLIPSILIWALDRAARAARTYALHSKSAGPAWITPAKADAKLFATSTDGDIVRLDFKMRASPWHVGQHFYLTFTEGSIWQSHPMTPLSHPRSKGGLVTHSYVFRAKSGETKKIADQIAKQLAAQPPATTTATTEKASCCGGGGGDDAPRVQVPVILTGPYGNCLADELTPRSNALCVAGGTGITYVLPVLLHLAGQELGSRKVDLVWVMRRTGDVKWVEPELETLRANPKISVRIFVSREADAISGTISGSSTDEIVEEKGVETKTSIVGGGRGQTREYSHPDLRECVREFVEDTAGGPTVVFGSGPVSMITDLRKGVAALNSGKRVWKGDERYDVALCYDERLER